MSVSIQPLFEPATLTNAAAVYATAQGPTRIDKLTCTNTDTAGHTVTIYWVPSGGSPGTGNIITPPRALQPGESWDVAQFIGHVLALGDTIQAKASANSVVNFFGSGTVLTT
jgi:hypothetical protein